MGMATQKRAPDQQYVDLTEQLTLGPRGTLSPADLFGGKAPVGALIGLLERIC